MKWRLEYDAALASGMFFEWFPKLSGEWEKDKDDFINELEFFRNPKEIDKSLVLNYPRTIRDNMFLIDEVGQYRRHKGWIQLEIYHAEGYFVGEWKMEPETSGRRVLTKTGWKGVRDFVNDHQPEDFLVTYNGVKYEIEDNKELFKKLFESEI